MFPSTPGRPWPWQALWLGLPPALAQHAQHRPGMPAAAQRAQVAIQMSDAGPAKWNLALDNARNIPTDPGAANADFVSSGVVEPMRKQQQGRAHLRP